MAGWKSWTFLPPATAGPSKRVSHMWENVPGRSCRAAKYFPFHKGKIRARRTERYAVPLIVGPYSREAIAPRHMSLEMIDA